MINKVNVLIRLFETIEKRSNDDPKNSYTASLLSDGKEKCIEKLKEEALETVEAFVNASPGYRGSQQNDTVVYCGEGRGGANANDAFFDYLLGCNNEEDVVLLPLHRLLPPSQDS